MRLSGPVNTGANPAEWIAAHEQLGYTAVIGPPFAEDDPRLDDYLGAAKRAGLPIAEVGAWSNPISPKAGEAKWAMDKCISSLALAERIEARCCVNIAGSRGERWDGPDPRNLDADTFDMIVASVRQIIDAVNPKRTFYSLETMPWIFPDSPDSYLALIRAIDRKQFAVHLDPVNMVNCPSRAYHTGDFLRECFAKLGSHIVSCHGKDIKFVQHLTLHLDECRPGQGVLDYATFIRELNKLPADTTLVLEHLPNAEEFAQAAGYVRSVMAAQGVK